MDERSTIAAVDTGQGPMTSRRTRHPRGGVSTGDRGLTLVTETGIRELDGRPIGKAPETVTAPGLIRAPIPARTRNRVAQRLTPKTAESGESRPTRSTGAISGESGGAEPSKASLGNREADAADHLLARIRARSHKSLYSQRDSRARC